MAFLDVTGFTVKHMLNLILMESADVARGGYECSFKINLEMLCDWDTFTSQLHREGLISNIVLRYRSNHLKGNPKTFNIVS